MIRPAEFCVRSCRNLSPTEEEQTDHREFHRCARYGYKRVTHLGHAPDLVRLGGCEEGRIFVVLVVGEREWSNGEDMIREALKFYGQVEGTKVRIIHSMSGVVAGIAARVAVEYGYGTKSVRAEWELYHEAAYKARNQRMVDLRPDAVYAFHKNLNKSVDTLDLITRALKVGLLVYRYGKGS